MLVHICCSVDSHYFLQKLHEMFPDEPLVGFFYDPNIHPYAEYALRLLDVRRSCEKLGIALHVGPYDYEGWLAAVRGLEEEPEKGKRCLVCFDSRLEVSAQKALELGEKKLTTTLLTSPKKSLDQLAHSLHTIALRYGLEACVVDVRKGGGTQAQFALSHKASLYHQDYCGCHFALSKQRETQKRLNDELFTPLRPQTLPASIEERIKLYEQVWAYEKEQRPFTIIKEQFLNYRLLWALVRLNAQVIPSYILFYSHFAKKRMKGELDKQSPTQARMHKHAVYFVSLEGLNAMLGTQYTQVRELLQNPLLLEQELHVRAQVCQGPLLGIDPIIILDGLEDGIYSCEAHSKLYEDIREILV